MIMEDDGSETRKEGKVTKKIIKKQEDGVTTEEKGLVK